MPVSAQELAKLDARLTDEIAEYYADPLGFVLCAYPWGEPDSPLAKFRGPDTWQRKFLEELGGLVKERAFDGSNPVMPIRMARASGHGAGKACSVNTLISTPSGEARWGDLEPGDSVFGSDGIPTRIVATHRYNRIPIYRVTFDDGSYSEVSSGHLWNVRGRQERRKSIQGWRTLETIELLELGVKRRNGSALARQWEIPVQGAVEFESREIDLHPYFVGAWLGDGSRGTPEYTKPYQEVEDRIASLGYETSRAADGKRVRVLGIIHLLTDPVFECRSHERFIPDRYKFNTIDNRMELFRGLCDTDGEVHHGSISYSSTSKKLAEDVVWLARSLGFKAWIQSSVKQGRYRNDSGEMIECRKCWRVTINSPFNPFSIPHKRDAYKPSEHRYQTRWIDSIEYSHDEDAMCITVDSPDGLYLTNDFIVTHNSALSAWLVDWIMSTRRGAIGTITANTVSQLETKTWAAVQWWTAQCITAHWFEVTSTRMWHRGSKSGWACAPITCREENSEAFAGQHNVSSTSFYLFDETSAVPDSILEVAEGGLTDGEPMIFLFGNPTRSQGKLYRVCFGSERHRWNHGSVDARNCKFPNKSQIDEWVTDYGEDSDFVRVRVRGLPPKASDSQFIPIDWVREAQQREVPTIPDEPLVAGCDLSWGGADFTCVRFRCGGDAKTIPPIKIHGEQSRDPGFLAMKLAEVLSTEWGPYKKRVHTLFMDSAGICGPVAQRLRQMGYANILEVNFGAHSPDPRYKLMRSYMWGRLKEWLPYGMIDRSSDLEEDLTTPGYKMTTKTEILLEPKPEIRKRQGHSTDDGDALGLTFAADVRAESTKKKRRREPVRHQQSWMGV